MWERDRGVCVVAVTCSPPAETRVVNHRVNRGAGGSKDPAINAPSSLHLACHECNGWLEDNPVRAEAGGWKVHHGVTLPADVPIRYPGGWWLLDNEGGRTMTEAPT